MGRKKLYRQKRHEQVHSLKSKSLFGHLVTELKQTQGISQKEAEIVAIPCFKYFKECLCDSAEGQIKFDIIKGVKNHKRTEKETKKATLTIFAYSDIELLEEFGVKAMRMGRILRLIEEAYLQSGLLDFERICFLTQISDRALRDRMHSLWKKKVFAPISMVSLKYRNQWLKFRQTHAIKDYLEGEDLKKVREKYFISKTQWESIYSTFRHINQKSGTDSIEDLADKFNIPIKLIYEYIEVADEYSDNYIYRMYNQNKTNIECPGNVNSRENFISELKKRCGFTPATADKLERDLRELSKKISSKKRADNEIVYYAVSDQEPPGKPLAECELTPVKIKYYNADDKEIFSVDSTSNLKWNRTERFATNARLQGGLLNQIDIAFLLGVSPVVLQKQTKEHENTVLPTRGNICDMGPSSSHAEDILSLYLQGYTETQITRRSGHNYESIERYIDNFTKVVGLLEEEGLNPAEIRKILGCSRRLVDKYIEIYHKFNTAEYQWWMGKIRKKYENRIKKKLQLGGR
ncbi:MAG: DUF1670 domain-containing protein [Bacillota bacterium]